MRSCGPVSLEHTHPVIPTDAAGSRGAAPSHRRLHLAGARARPTPFSTVRRARVLAGGCALDLDLVTAGVTRCRSCHSLAPGKEKGNSSFSCCPLVNDAATISAPAPLAKMAPSPVDPSAGGIHWFIAETRAAVPSVDTGCSRLTDLAPPRPPIDCGGRCCCCWGCVCCFGRTAPTTPLAPIDFCGPLRIHRSPPSSLAPIDCCRCRCCSWGRVCRFGSTAPLPPRLP